MYSPVITHILAVLALKAADYAVNFLKKSPRPRGAWAGSLSALPATPTDTFSAGYFHDADCVRLMVDSRDRARFVHESGAEYAISSGVSDGGSIPYLAQMGLLPIMDLRSHGKLAWPFYLHDCGYRDGGLTMRPSATEDWVFLPMTKDVVDLIFFQACTAVKGVRAIEAITVYRGVRTTFAVMSWNAHRSRDGK